MPRLWIPIALSVLFVLALGAGPALMAQLPPSLLGGAGGHAHGLPYADVRPWLGVPNAADTLSNLPFALLGLAVIHRLRRPLAASAEARMALAVLALGLLATALGSGHYHLRPTAERLVVDRMGMAVLFAGVLGLALAERGPRTAVLPVLLSLTPLGLLAAALPRWGHLLPWGLVQYGGVLALLALAWRPLQPEALGVRWGWVLTAYALAKLCESLDAPIYELTAGVVSGHTLKHLLAAAALGPVLWALHGRRPDPSAATAA